MDDKLTWTFHIAHVKTKVSKNISVLNKAKYVGLQGNKRILYCYVHSFLPYFSYCVKVWGNTYMSTKPLFYIKEKGSKN